MVYWIYERHQQFNPFVALSTSLPLSTITTYCHLGSRNRQIFWNYSLLLLHNCRKVEAMAFILHLPQRPAGGRWGNYTKTQL